MDAEPNAVPVTHVPADTFRDGEPTPGMTRHVGLDVAGMWSGTVDTEAGAVSGWHHHGSHETTIYVVRGRMRLDSGPDGATAVDAQAGDFIHVPAYAVHRESNPGDEASKAVVVRCGDGPPTFNVDGPAT
jgi:uncharacterized RmlC-like cupin family protein